MNISIDNLQDLYKKYQKMKEKFEEKLKEINDKLNTLDKNFALFKEEGFIEKETEKKIEPISNKFSQMTKPEAIKSILKSNQEKWWSGKEITESLLLNGFKCNSTNLLRDVYGDLNRLGKQGKGEIISKKEAGQVKYKVKVDGSLNQQPLFETSNPSGL